MYKRILRLLFIIFSSYHAQAQQANNFTPVPGGSSSYQLFDVKQQVITTISPGGKQLSLFIFLSPECPLSQNYTSTINQLQEKFGPQVNIYGIIPGNAYTKAEVNDFENKYHTAFRILIDPKKELTGYLEATVTPQAVLLDSRDHLIYTGAIDDWVQGLGKKKIQPTRHYVVEAIQQSLQPAPVKVNKTPAFGCKINDY